MGLDESCARCACVPYCRFVLSLLCLVLTLTLFLTASSSPVYSVYRRFYVYVYGKATVRAVALSRLTRLPSAERPDAVSVTRVPTNARIVAECESSVLSELSAETCLSTLVSAVSSRSLF